MQAGRLRLHLLLLSISLISVFTPCRAAADIPELDDPMFGRGQLAVSARVAHTQIWWGRSEWLGSVSLVIPLERLGAPPLLPRVLGAEPGDETPAAPSPPPPREIHVTLTPTLARDAVRAALRASGHARSGRRLEGLASRASSSALLPEVRLRGARTTDESLRLTPTQSDPYRYTQAGGVSTTLEARLTWKLDRLLFADQELDVERLRGQRAAAARSLVREVIKTLVAWQRAEIRASDPDLPPEERVDALLAALEATATLDVLTNGWFSWKLERSARKRARRP